MLWCWQIIGHLRHSGLEIYCRGIKKKTHKGERTLVLTVSFEQNPAGSSEKPPPTPGATDGDLGHCPTPLQKVPRRAKVLFVCFIGYHLNPTAFLGILCGKDDCQHYKQLDSGEWDVATSVGFEGWNVTDGRFLTRCNSADIWYFYFLLLTLCSGTGGSLQRLSNILSTN